MASWTTFDGSDIPAIASLTDALGSMQGPIETAQTAASVTKTAMQVLSALSLSAPDPLLAVRATITQLINSLTLTQIGVLVVRPSFKTATNYRGVSGFLKVLSDSFSDTADLNRPQFPIGTLSGGIVLLVSAPTLAELAAIIDGMQAIFGPDWRELQAYVNSLPGEVPPYTSVVSSGMVTGFLPGVDRGAQFLDQAQVVAFGSPNQLDPYLGDVLTAFSGKNVGTSAKIESFDTVSGEFTLTPGFGFPLEVGDVYVISAVSRAAPPDWSAKRLVDVMPALADATELLARARDSIPNVSVKSGIDALIAGLDRKIALFSAMLAQISQVVALLTDIGSVTGIGFVAIPPQALGNQGFLQELYRADDPPGVAANSYTAGIVLYGGAVEYAALAGLFPV